MESQLAFLDCPAWLDEGGLARCGLPAEVLRRFIMESTSGPLESVIIKCPAGHSFIAPIEFLSLESATVTGPPPGSRDGADHRPGPGLTAKEPDVDRP